MSGKFEFCQGKVREMSGNFALSIQFDPDILNLIFGYPKTELRIKKNPPEYWMSKNRFFDITK